MSLDSASMSYQFMAQPHFFEDSLQFMARDIKDQVANGQESWENLGFTEADVDERLRQGMARVARVLYDDMNNPVYSDISAEGFAYRIRRIVNAGYATWSELGFSEADVDHRLEQAKGRPNPIYAWPVRP